MLGFLKRKRFSQIAECNEQLEEQSGLLGPFVGSITESSVKIWLYIPTTATEQSISIFITLCKENENTSTKPKEINLTNDLGVGIVEFTLLEPDSQYFYRLWQDEKGTIPLDLQELKIEDLYFRTLPENGFDKQLDFLLMSCHNPFTAVDDGHCGFAVWRQMPEIINRNKNVRFAILAGDQVYGDEIEAEMLSEQDPKKRQESYLRVYRKFWSNIYYRKVLCSLPAILMWDDHDITDGWGSREDSFVDKKSSEFKPEWKKLFGTARDVFKWMQAERNPPPLSKDFEIGFDTCFKVGSAGFIVADLRSNRNARKKQIWHPQQLEIIKNWVETNKKDLKTLFFVSSVVFSHGAPQIEQSILKYWFHILDLTNWFGRRGLLKKTIQKFNEKIGDLRDDINDSWGSDVNRNEADKALDFLFSVQNPPDGINALNVVILSGDIHTPGYSTLYSADPNHKRAVIPHIVATPVAYQPFSWIGEAVFRHLTRTVELGNKQVELDGKKVQQYTAQVSHHFCYRNVVVVSLRNYEEDESYLKVKYYLEGYPEPQVMLFNLNKSSGRESIEWEDVKAKQPIP